MTSGIVRWLGTAQLHEHSTVARFAATRRVTLPGYALKGLRRNFKPLRTGLEIMHVVFASLYHTFLGCKLMAYANSRPVKQWAGTQECRRSQSIRAPVACKPLPILSILQTKVHWNCKVHLPVAAINPVNSKSTSDFWFPPT